jgi:hypothetical protein
MSKPTITYRGTTYTVLFPDLLRPLTEAEREELRDDIKRNGVLVPVVVDEHDGIIDGINRLTIAADQDALAGGWGKVRVRFEVRRNLTLKAKRDLALSLNVHRRHLSADELHELRQGRIQRVAEGHHQGKSTRQLAEEEGVSQTQVQQDGPPTREEMGEVARQVIAFSRRLRRHLKALAAVTPGSDFAEQFGNDAEGFDVKVRGELRRLGDDLFDFRWHLRRSSWTRRPGTAAPRRREMTVEEALGVLGLTEPCTREQVRDAYRRLALERHPDHGGSTEAFQQLQEACDVALKYGEFSTVP